MGNKKINALPEGFMDAFSSALDDQLAVEKSITAPEAPSELEEEIQSLRRQIAIAQNGGVGDVSKLSRQLSEAKYKLQESLAKKPEAISEETDLAEATWTVKYGKKTYRVKAINSSQANDKAEKAAKREGNHGSFVSGSIKRISEEADLEEKKAPVTDKLDDGHGMDPVGKGDADIDNDGDTDDSDKYLHKRRKAIGKAMKKKG